MNFLNFCFFKKCRQKIMFDHALLNYKLKGVEKFIFNVV